ncbi:class Ib ribonucleoside-diphosphate reductase assembly flavoprotein NrdI [Priestia aryabhattai]|uniref:class Ib ribonucleoside-diphosphate reductase assembly flavoprotein NrdI n=1 Tax=Priestia aryabhattai TaxID=412384 RepID=UPI0015F61D9A|nr:class Ib ribonucleoside-diphosphate reductase assembly flavoprotein NrdI [Priestia aryabhattai]
MIIVYDSLTGNVKRFIDKVKKTNKNLRVENIASIPVVDEDYILVTYTIGMGKVSDSTQEFLNKNSNKLKAVVVSGNIVWGSNFGKAGDIISKQYNVPLIMKIELSGTKQNVDQFIQEVAKFDNNSKMDSTQQ